MPKTTIEAPIESWQRFIWSLETLSLCAIYECALYQTKNKRRLVYTYSEEGRAEVDSHVCKVNCANCPQ